MSKLEAKFLKFLKIVEVGFKTRSRTPALYLKLGYSHEVELAVPPAFTAAVCSCKPPEVYKGKGIMYVDEVIKKKAGKKSK